MRIEKKNGERERERERERDELCLLQLRAELPKRV